MVGLKAYPIVISHTFAVVFAYSLLRPPTITEEIVRLRRPDLPSCDGLSAQRHDRLARVLRDQCFDLGRDGI